MSEHARLPESVPSFRALIQSLIQQHPNCAPGDGTTPDACGRLAQLVEVCHQRGWTPYPR
ncbi:hypothetical protein ACWEKT_26675 [Nocardia takedensis]